MNGDGRHRPSVSLGNERHRFKFPEATLWRGLPTTHALILSVKKSRQPTIRH